jgi:uncharacterized repeat protein (TIGR03803 family)
MFTGKDGELSNRGLVADEAGNLYGTALGGDVHNLGAVFELSPDPKLTHLHVFI